MSGSVPSELRARAQLSLTVDTLTVDMRSRRPTEVRPLSKVTQLGRVGAAFEFRHFSRDSGCGMELGWAWVEEKRSMLGAGDWRF